MFVHRREMNGWVAPEAALEVNTSEKEEPALGPETSPRVPTARSTPNSRKDLVNSKHSSLAESHPFPQIHYILFNLRNSVPEESL